MDIVGMHPKPGLSRVPGARCLVGAVAMVALIGELASPAAAQALCTRDGSWLVCENGERYAIRTDPFFRPRMFPGRMELAPPGDGTRDDGAAGGALLQSSDGLVCWAHGDHAHCQ